MRTDVANPYEDLLNSPPHGHRTDRSGEPLADERCSIGGEAGLTVGRVCGRALRWMGGAGGGVLALGAAATCCGGVSLGLVGVAAGVAGVAAGLGAVLVALVSALTLGGASIARRRRSPSGCGSNEPGLNAQRGRNAPRSGSRR